MSTIIIRALQINIKKLITYFSINTLFIVLLASMFPIIQKEGDKLNELLDSYPEGMMQAFGLEGGNFFSDFSAFIGGEHFSMLWPILIIVFIISFASYAIAGEIEKGTINLLLSQPISRIKLYFAKFLAGLSLLGIFIILTIWAVWPIAKIFGIDMAFGNLVTLSIGGFLFGFAIMGLNFMFSSFVSARAKASGLTMGVVVVMYALNLLANLNADYEIAKYFSYFHYFDYNVLLIDNTITWQALTAFLTSGVVFASIGAYLFNKRDISV